MKHQFLYILIILVLSGCTTIKKRDSYGEPVPGGNTHQVHYKDGIPFLVSNLDSSSIVAMLVINEQVNKLTLSILNKSQNNLTVSSQDIVILTDTNDKIYSIPFNDINYFYTEIDNERRSLAITSSIARFADGFGNSQATMKSSSGQTYNVTYRDSYKSEQLERNIARNVSSLEMKEEQIRSEILIKETILPSDVVTKSVFIKSGLASSVFFRVKVGSEFHEMVFRIYPK